MRKCYFCKKEFYVIPNDDTGVVLDIFCPFCGRKARQQDIENQYSPLLCYFKRVPISEEDREIIRQNYDDELAQTIKWTIESSNLFQNQCDPEVKALAGLVDLYEDSLHIVKDENGVRYAEDSNHEDGLAEIIISYFQHILWIYLPDGDWFLGMQDRYNIRAS